MGGWVAKKKFRAALGSAAPKAGPDSEEACRDSTKDSFWGDPNAVAPPLKGTLPKPSLAIFPTANPFPFLDRLLTTQDDSEVVIAVGGVQQ